MPCIIYLRVSTQEQRIGLQSQLKTCQEHAQDQEQQFQVFMDDGISGSKPVAERPGLMEAIEQVKKGDQFVIARRDRLGRDPIVVAMAEAAIKRKGGEVVSCAGEGSGSEHPADILMKRVVDGFSEYERLIIRQRTKAAMKSLKAQGRRVGSIKYGYSLAEDGKHLIPKQEEQMVIEEVKFLKDGGMSFRAIGEELAKNGMLTRNGKPFAAPQVWRIYHGK